MGAEDTSIQVSRTTWDRLGELARERGTTIRGLVEELAAAAPTQAELRARAEAARVALRDGFGIEVTAEDEAAGQRLWDRLGVGPTPTAGAA